MPDTTITEFANTLMKAEVIKQWNDAIVEAIRKSTKQSDRNFYASMML